MPRPEVPASELTLGYASGSLLGRALGGISRLPPPFTLRLLVVPGQRQVVPQLVVSVL